MVDVIDVGVGASHLNSAGDPKDGCKLIEGYHNIVFAIGYDTPDDPLMHGAFLAEVETACELDGSKFLHLDVAMAGRWDMHDVHKHHSSMTMVWHAMTDSGLKKLNLGFVDKRWTTFCHGSLQIKLETGPKKMNWTSKWE